VATRVSELRQGEGRGGYADLDDRLLVLDFQAGDPEAFAEIHRRYVALSRYVCLRILSDRDESDEAVQETWIRVFRGLHTFNGRYALQPWIARIATNVAVDVTRTRARRPQLADTPLEAVGDEIHDDPFRGPEETVERQFDIDLVHQVLSSLPVHHRRALMLREFEGRSHEEIAAELDVTPAQAKALIHRAKKSFRAAWERAGGPMVLHALAVPFLLPGRLFDQLKRLIGRAHEAGTAAVAQAGETVQTATLAAPTVSHVGDKIVAGAVTLLVAGTIAVGPGSLLRHRPAPVPSATTSPTIAATVPSLVEPPVQHRTRLPVSKPQPKRSRRATHVRPSPPVVSVAPTPPPTPVVLPEPEGFTMAAQIDATSGLRCGCGKAPVTTDAVSITQDGLQSFDEQVDGAALVDGSGTSAWQLAVHDSSDDGSSHALTFDLMTPDGPERFIGSGHVVSSRPLKWGGWTYVFAGSYEFSAGPPDGQDLIPAGGTYRVVVTFSVASARVVAMSLNLNEQAPTPTPSPSATPTEVPSPSVDPSAPPAF
jgi:RNA polymerase sigma-70 factor, ECF subfamily